MNSVSPIISLVYVIILTSVINCDELDCNPSNWKHTWTRSGSVWYTHIKKPGDWKSMEQQCKAIESGRTSLASIRSIKEKNHIVSADFADGEIWTGGGRISDNLWFWYNDNGKRKTLTDISPTFWSPGRPRTGGPGDELCIGLYNFDGNGTWFNAPCESKKPALCEIRCNDAS